MAIQYIRCISEEGPVHFFAVIIELSIIKNIAIHSFGSLPDVYSGVTGR
jgi:hypothetical protein